MNHGTKQRWLCGLAATAVLGTFGVSQATASGRAPAAQSLPALPPRTAAVGSQPSISGDGQFVVYAAAPGDPNDDRASSAWFRDLLSGFTIELTVPSTGVRPGETVTPVISADGCTAVVVTEMALDLFRDDDAGSRWDVYSLTLPQCTLDPATWTPTDWTIVSERSTEAANNAVPGSPPAVSGSGSVIAYVHQFSSTETALTTITITDLTVLPETAGRTTRMLGTPNAAPETTYRYHGLRDPAMSDDGTLITYTSDATSAIQTPGWAVGPAEGQYATSAVYIWDRANPANVVVAATSATADGQSGHSSVSSSGQLIAFESSASNLVANTRSVSCDVTCSSQVYLLDRTTKIITLVSGLPATSTTPALAGDSDSIDPVVSADGSTVVFVSRSQNLFPISSGAGGSSVEGDIVSASTAGGPLRRLSVLPDGSAPAPALNSSPALSGNARVVVFETLAGLVYGPDAISAQLNPVAAVATAPTRQIVTVIEPTNVTIADLDVGTVSIGFLGPEWFVKLINLGNSSFTPASIVSSNPQFALSGAPASTCFVGVPLAPGQECRIALTMTPTAAGPVTGTLTIAEVGYLGSTITAKLTGAGGDPLLNPAVAGGRWPQVAVGQNGESKTFNVLNVGFVPVTVAAVKIIGPNAGDFTLVGSDCKSAPFGVGSSCSIEVVFTPTENGHRTATVRVSTPEGFYTSILLDGDAFYATSVIASSPTVIAGSQIVIGGTGFSPNSTVTLLWADGAGASYTAQTNEVGQFLQTITVSRAERTGPRQLVAQTASGEHGSIDVSVLPRQRPIAVNSPLFPRP